MAKEKRAIFRTKSEILMARDVNNVQIAEDVMQKPEFISAKMTDMLGLTITSGSDYTVIDAINVQNDPRAFMQHAFGTPKKEE